MKMNQWNQIPPIKEGPNKSIRVPLDIAIKDPRTVVNPITRTPLQPQPNELPTTKVIKIRGN